MHAEIVSVGTELLLGQILDTHAPAMARILAECGISCTRRETVGDNFDRLVATLKGALERADVVITIGGLGPTLDDLTRDAIAVALGDELVTEPAVEERLRRFFAQRGLPWVDSIARQAQRPASGRQIDNPNGTAPGLWCEKNGKTVIALPGPKGEFNPMAEGPVREALSALGGQGVIHSRTLRIVGMGESQVEERVRPLMDGTNPTVAPYAHTGEVHLRLTARAANRSEAEQIIDPVDAQIREILGAHVFGADGVTLEEALLDQLRGQNLTLAVAESMTGGGLGERLSSIAGASDVFTGGVIAYRGVVKEGLLGVRPETLAGPGPVSAECALEMAYGVRAACHADIGVSITGNAGPGVDVDQKPVGLVFVAVVGPHGETVEETRYRGVREDIRRRATQLALMLVRNSIS